MWEVRESLDDWDLPSDKEQDEDKAIDEGGDCEVDKVVAWQVLEMPERKVKTILTVEVCWNGAGWCKVQVLWKAFQNQWRQ